jgi:hypothetical protein
MNILSQKSEKMGLVIGMSTCRSFGSGARLAALTASETVWSAVSLSALMRLRTPLRLVLSQVLAYKKNIQYIYIHTQTYRVLALQLYMRVCVYLHSYVCVCVCVCMYIYI